MQIENETEVSRKRIKLLENQNARFKSLLESVLAVTNPTPSKSNLLRDEHQFLEDTIKLIEDEKQKMQEELEMLTASKTISTENQLKKMESENLELRKKVEVLLTHAKKQTKEIQQLKAEQSEFKFLLTQPNVDTRWLRNILQLDTLTKNTSLPLVQERHKLQNRIITLERRKTELLLAIEDVSKSNISDEQSKEFIKTNIERCVSKALDEAEEKEFEELQEKVNSLEIERSELLNQLQTVLDNSRNEIASEYCKLQQKILEIETHKAEILLKLKSVDNDSDLSKRSSTKFTQIEANQIDNVLSAFTNISNTLTMRRSESQTRYSASGLPTCTIL